MNDKFVHVGGPFTAGDDIVTWIRNNYDSSMRYIKKCGVQSITSHEVVVNGNRFEIGKAALIEFNDVRITSLYFSQDEPATTLVDCIIE